MISSHGGFPQACHRSSKHQRMLENENEVDLRESVGFKISELSKAQGLAEQNKKQGSDRIKRLAAHWRRKMRQRCRILRQPIPFGDPASGGTGLCLPAVLSAVVSTKEEALAKDYTLYTS